MKTIFCISGYHFSKSTQTNNATTHGVFCLSFSFEDFTKLRYLQETNPNLFSGQWCSIYHDCFKNGYLKLDFNFICDHIDQQHLIDQSDSFIFFSTDIKQIHNFYDTAMARVYKLPLVAEFIKPHGHIVKYYDRYSKLSIIK
jgi:hypothetical protein